MSKGLPGCLRGQATGVGELGAGEGVLRLVPSRPCLVSLCQEVQAWELLILDRASLDAPCLVCLNYGLQLRWRRAWESPVLREVVSDAAMVSCTDLPTMSLSPREKRSSSLRQSFTMLDHQGLSREVSAVVTAVLD